MSLSRTLLLKIQSPLCKFSIYRTLASSSAQTHTDQNKKPLNLLFQEAVGLSQETVTDIHFETQNNEVKKKLWELEKEVRDLKEAESRVKSKNLYELFAGKKVAENSNNDKGNQNVKSKDSETPKSLHGLFRGDKCAEKLQIETKEEEELMVFKELSEDMRMFLSHLYKESYFNNANFLRQGKLDFSCFDNHYGRGFIKFAAEKFGKDNQDIAKWLSGSDLKKVALFGCPSFTRKNVFSAKRLRQYFEIQEHTVCSKCVLKNSCKFVNQSVWKGDYKTLNLAVVMRVITLYALEEWHPDLSVPEEIKASVSQLLKEAAKLSRTI